MFYKMNYSHACYCNSLVQHKSSLIWRQKSTSKTFHLKTTNFVEKQSMGIRIQRLS